MSSDHLKKFPILEVDRKIDLINSELNQIKSDLLYIKNFITIMKKSREEYQLEKDQLRQQGWWWSYNHM